MSQYDPNGIDQHTEGAKLDGGKPKVSTYFLRYFPRAIKEIAKVSEYGANKYTPKGWEKVESGIERYEDAEVRHILEDAIGGPQDDESKLVHAAHKAWNAVATLELMLRCQEEVNKTWEQVNDILPLTPKQPELTLEEDTNPSVSHPVMWQETLEFGDVKFVREPDGSVGMRKNSNTSKSTSKVSSQSSIMLSST